MRVFVAALCLITLTANAAIINVPGDHSTIQAAANAAVAGDTVQVADGTYNERITLPNSGSSGNYITFKGNATGTGVVSYGFVVASKNYIRIIGMEIRHVNTTYRRGVSIEGTTQHLEIIDCYIHDTHWPAISCTTDTASRFITIRGNNIWYVCHPGSIQDPDGAIIGNFVNGFQSDWLIEYNSVNRSGDGFNLYGTNVIARNNWYRDAQVSYWNSIGFHWDGFQSGSDGANVGLRTHLYEANLIGELRGDDGHFGIWQDVENAGDTNVLIRGNIGYNLGSGGMGFFGTDGARVYQNTFYSCPSDATGGIFVWYGSSGSTNGFLGNNIIAQVNSLASDPISIETSPMNYVTVTNNLGYLAGSEPSYVSTSNPDFVSTASLDFRLNTGSPAINLGTTNITRITSADGSGTTFNVDYSVNLSDGRGMVEGDVVTISGTTTRITGISGAAVTVAASVTWITGTSVIWGTDSAPDVGAIPHGTTRLTYATIVQNGTTYTVTPTGTTRGVWFYVDGIPTTWDVDVPYQQTIASGTVTAKAYALYAQTSPVVNATLTDDTVYNLNVSGTLTVGTLEVR